MFSLVDPFELPKGILDLQDMEDLTNCTCPRSFYAVCGKDNETYFNACVLNCLKKTKIRRLGPCIIYRRSNTILLDMKIPSIWKNSTNAAEIMQDEELESVLLAVPKL